MNLGWEPDDIVAVVDELHAALGEPALVAVDRALARTAMAFGQTLNERDRARVSPKQFVRHFTDDPSEHCTVLEASETRSVLRTTRCRIADAFRALGRCEIGYRFKCSQDFCIARGYDPSMTLRISKCLMTGDSVCIHEYEKQETQGVL